MAKIFHHRIMLPSKQKFSIYLDATSEKQFRAIRKSLTKNTPSKGWLSLGGLVAEVPIYPSESFIFWVIDGMRRKFCLEDLTREKLQLINSQDYWRTGIEWFYTNLSDPKAYDAEKNNFLKPPKPSPLKKISLTRIDRLIRFHRDQIRFHKKKLAEAERYKKIHYSSNTKRKAGSVRTK